MKKFILHLTFFLIVTCCIGQDHGRLRLGDHINTPYDETKPVISYDNQTLYLARQYFPDNYGGEDDIQDIYAASLTDSGTWMKPVNLEAPLNNRFPNGISSLSQDGSSALVINVFKKNRYKNGASLSKRDYDTWDRPVPIDIKKFKNLSNYIDYFETADGNHMFLAIDNGFSVGDQDLYVSFRISDLSWTEPINLGKTVNTDKAEFSPFLSSDNKILFFASYGHDSYGDSDIFYSRRLDDSWTNWSPPVNMGSMVNSGGFEAYYTIPSQGDYAYFVSNHGSNDGSKDIFRALIPNDLNPTPGVIYSGVAKSVNEVSIEDVELDIVQTDGHKPEKDIWTNKDGYETLLEYGHTYSILPLKKGYMSIKHYARPVKGQDEKEVLDLHLVPIAHGNTLISYDVKFLPSTDFLDKAGVNELLRIKSYLTENPNVSMGIAAYIGEELKDDIKSILIDSRLEIIRKFFLSHGIDERRVLESGQWPQSAMDEMDTTAVNMYNRKDMIAFTILEHNKPSDTDRDGVPDDIDKCIDEVGTVENSGCPELNKKVKEVLVQAISGIKFESGKDILKTLSYAILDDVATIMLDNPQLYLRISGYTDSQGREENNLVLSRKRANATLNYIQGKGVNGDRMRAYGFGEASPIADNETAAGRAKNRRVEFQVVYDLNDL